MVYVANLVQFKHMDNQETLQQGFELPKPTVDTALPGGSSPEIGSSHESVTSVSQAPGSMRPMSQVMPLSDPLVAGTSQQPQSSSTQTAHLVAEDADLIEKEWVQKAKDIVAQTHGDPYRQNKEINKIKADYIKKRYNKDIVQQSGE